jgi:hypothetical protein
MHESILLQAGTGQPSSMPCYVNPRFDLLVFFPQFPTDEDASIDLDISAEALAAKNEKVRDYL